MEAKIENGQLTVTLPINMQPSKSGKTMLVATTHGNHATTATVDGKPVIVSVNAYVYKS